jgi:hypothetical protein
MDIITLNKSFIIQLGFNSEVQQMDPRIPQTELESQGIFLDGG